jgi:predicted GNAT superfamily acetyltransferase
MATSEASGNQGVSAEHSGAPSHGHAAAHPIDSLTIRRCTALEEMQAAFALQKEVWNFSDAELVPVRLFVLANKIGGHVIGAFDQNDLVAFAVAFPASRNGHSYLHSHMLGVRQQYRNAGLGRRMKLFQRDQALAHGFELMEWTFDPLEIKNSYLNIEKLGAIARRYNVNQYGITTSPLQGGLPTDRLVAEWWLKSKRVESVLADNHRPTFASQTTISVPAEIYQWKAAAATRAQALALQRKNREALSQAFDAGLSVLGYERTDHGDGRFLLGQWDESWLY